MFWVQCVLNWCYEEQAQIKAQVSCKCSPASCHMQDEGEAHTLSSHHQLRSVPLRQSSQPDSQQEHVSTCLSQRLRASQVSTVQHAVWFTTSQDQLRQQSLHQLFLERVNTHTLDWQLYVQNKVLSWEQPYTTTPSLALRTNIYIQNNTKWNHATMTTPTKYAFVDFSAFGKMNMHKISIQN